MSTARRSLASLAIAALILGAPTVAAARPVLASEGDQIVLSGSVTVPKGRSVDEVVVLHGGVRIAGVAYGDVVVIDGGISIYGQVSGSVIAVNGSVYLGPDAQVRGDVIARDAVRVETGAKVTGSIREHVAFTWRTPVSVFGRLASWLAVTVSTLALGMLLISVAPRGADAVFDAGRSSPWASLGWGAAVFAGLPLLGIGALVSLVGLPFGLALLLALALLFSVGYAYSAWAIGRLLWGPARNRVLAFLFGWLIVRVIALAPVVSGISWALGAVFGLGRSPSPLASAATRRQAPRGTHDAGRRAPVISRT